MWRGFPGGEANIESNERKSGEKNVFNKRPAAVFASHSQPGADDSPSRRLITLIPRAAREKYLGCEVVLVKFDHAGYIHVQRFTSLIFPAWIRKDAYGTSSAPSVQESGSKCLSGTAGFSDCRSIMTRAGWSAQPLGTAATECVGSKTRRVPVDDFFAISSTACY